MAEPITFGAVMQGLGALTSVTGGVLGFGQAAKQKAANQFYQTGNSVREQSAGALLPAQTCAACGTAVGLCYSSTSADDVCCTGCTFTSYTSSVVKTTRSEACGTAQTATYYHNGTGATPVVYNFVYSNSNATTKLGAGYYSLSATSVIYVNSNGMVENLLTC